MPPISPRMSTCTRKGPLRRAPQGRTQRYHLEQKTAVIKSVTRTSSARCTFLPQQLCRSVPIFKHRLDMNMNTQALLTFSDKVVDSCTYARCQVLRLHAGYGLRRRVGSGRVLGYTTPPTL